MFVNCFCCKRQFNKSPSEIKRSKTGRHFCSRSCSAKVTNVGQRRNPPVDRICKGCKVTYHTTGQHRSISFCKKCSGELNQHKFMTLREAQESEYLKGRHRSWINSRVRNFARSWNKNLKEHPCQNCGYSKHVEFCHIKSIASFDLDAKLGEINSPENIAILCRNCHWEFDHGEITIEQIPTR